MSRRPRSDARGPVGIVARPGSDLATTPRAKLVERLMDAENTLRAITTGQVDAFVFSDDRQEQRIFTLSTADRPYRIFVENMRDGAATLSPGGLILYANQRLTELLGRTRKQIVGSDLAALVAGPMPAELLLESPAVDGGTVIELALVHQDGAEVPVLAGISRLDVDGDMLICVTFTDLRAQKAQDMEIDRLARMQAERLVQLQAAQDALVQQATHDALTGLPNRMLLVDRIGQALAQATRSGRCTVVLFLDLDDFKHVNDTRGHAAGDAELQHVARRLVAALRPMDTVARIGGDEFVVLAPDVTSHLDSVDMGNRLVEALAERSNDDGQVGPVAVSVGIAISARGAGTAETLLHQADIAMYHAKSRGGARAEVFDEALSGELRDRAAAQGLVKSALDEKRVTAHYQPIIDLGARTVVAFEALARIIDADGTILPPAAFIPAAEASGLISPLGTSMLRVACGAAREWTAHRSVAVAVNLSPRQFESGKLPGIVRDTLEASGLDPHDLHLELTETTIMDLRPDVLQQLGLIRELGVQIGLDDFGTGYASLTHLRRLPLSFVKIDRSFVKGIGTDVEDERIVSSVIDLAANLGLRSIAEGVETGEQLARLEILGADEAQGFYIGRPAPGWGDDGAASHLSRIHVKPSR